MSRLRYLRAAFNARPLGMPLPPNWAGIAAFGMLGGLVNPGFWLIGAGLELGYLWWLSANERFRATVDGQGGAAGGDEWDRRRAALVAGLSPDDRAAQEDLEARCEEILATLRDRPAAGAHGESLAALAWLHLRLLAARTALRQLARGGERDAGPLAQQEDRLRARLARTDLEPELRRTLEQQAEVIRARREAHAEGARRLDRVDAELERIRQQVALVRDQALLATDEAEVARSVDALSASLNEANRWLQGEQDLLAGLDLSPAPPPGRFPGAGARRRHRSVSQSSTGESS